MVRIPENRVEIDHAVKRAAGPDPLINRLPRDFLGFRVVARQIYAFKRANRGANQLDPASVSASDQLPVSVDQVLGSANIGWIGKVVRSQLCAGESDVIDSLEHHNVRDAG